MSTGRPDQPSRPGAAEVAGGASPFALGLLLRRAHVRAAARMAEALRPLGVEPRHFAVLSVLADRGPTVQRDLAEAAGSDKAGIMRVVDDLERKGLAVRRAVPEDRRVRAVELTPQGLALVDAAHAAARPLEPEWTAPLRAAEAEQLAALLARFTGPAADEA